MGIIAAISNIQIPFPMEVISQGGEAATVSLIVSLFLALLISDTRYWNKWASSTLKACYSAFLITFAAIVAFKVMMTLQAA